MITIKQLSGVSIEIIHRAFAEAFADYVESFDLSVQQLQFMIERRGYDPELSFGAFNQEKLVGFTLNGIGDWNGKLTVYDTGTGIIKEYRKQGIATRIFNESLPVLRENKISQYLLEVIRSNTKAFDLYKKSGFKVVREFEYYVSAKDDIKSDQSKIKDGFIVKEIYSPDWDLFKTCWDFGPSWQNSIDSIKRKLEFCKILGIFEGDSFAGYGIIELHTGDIPQFAVNKKYRRKGLASGLLKQLIQLAETDSVKIINIDSRDTAMKQFLNSINLSPGAGQYEMLLNL